MDEQNRKNQFYDDEPTEDTAFLRINEISNIIKDIVLDRDLKTPFPICINGEWGSGKTSLLKLIHKKLQDYEGICGPRLQLVLIKL